MSEPLISRFNYVERVVHWVVGVTFVALLASGLAFAYPSFFWLTAPFGGGPAARVLHPWIGVVFGVGMIFVIVLWIREMFLDDSDWKWLGAVGDYATHRYDKVPDAGKYNAGQKVFFWAQAALAGVFVVTGLLLWMPASFGSTALAVSRLVHYVATLGAGLMLVVHVYLGTVAYPGTARGMIDGKVTRRWADMHHPRWSRDHESADRSA